MMSGHFLILALLSRIHLSFYSCRHSLDSCRVSTVDRVAVVADGAHLSAPTKNQAVMDRW